MTTNQTIDGVLVPRELLELAMPHLIDSFSWASELRALLDADKVNNRQMGLMQFVEAHPIKPTGLSQGWNLTRKHDGFVVGHQSVAYAPDAKAIERAERDGYVWVPFLVPAEQPAPVAVSPIQEDREALIGYGRSSGLEEASTLCTRLAYAAYYPPGTRFKAFTPKTQKALGDLLIKAANEIASLPGGPYERFKARQAKKAESAKSR